MTRVRRITLRKSVTLSLALLVAASVVGVADAGAATPAGSPTGNLDALQITPAGLQVNGWTYDPDAPTRPIQVRVYSDSAFVGQTLARGVRADLARARPAAGPNHGFNLTYKRPAGTHKMCVYAINVLRGANRSIGCKVLTFGASPRGGIDSLTQVSGGFRISGWTIDPEVVTPISVNIGVDGKRVAQPLANQANAAAGRAYPAYGNAHGFVWTQKLPQGKHTICAYGRNAGPAGQDQKLGCRTITLNFEPRGTIDGMQQIPGGIAMSGWAFDPDTQAPISLHIQLDGRPVKVTTANVKRPDVARAYPAAGAMHGYSANIRATAGTHTVCVYGMNVDWGVSNPRLACRKITLNFAPFGALESAARTSTGTRISLTGWAADPDTSQPIQVRMLLDNRVVASAVANVSRPDVAKARHISALHGFRTSIPVNANEHTVCVQAVNAAFGTTNKSLGCRVIWATHPGPPSAPRVTAVAGSGSARVNWVTGRDGGAPLKWFTVRSSPGNKALLVSSTKRTAVISGLAAGMRYTFTVTVTNAAGKSSIARSNIVTTPKGPGPQTTPPPVSTSRYPRNLKGTTADTTLLRSWGAADAARNPSGHAYLVLLDIGGQNSTGVVLSASTGYLSYASLVRSLNAYVDGYASRRRAGAPVVIALGTNNDMTVSSTTGAIWARQVVNPVAAHAAHYGGISVAGANDIEPGFSANAAQSKAWLTGYLHATTRPFVFNGSADGCGWSQLRSHCNNGWTAGDLYWLSGGASPSRIIGLPQIYNNTMAQQWKYISLTGVGSSTHHKINFGGPLTEWTACQQAHSCSSMTGGNAWVALWKAIRSDARSSQGSLPYSTDLRIN